LAGSTPSIFQDPNGRRAGIVNRVLSIFAAVASVFLVFFGVSLLSIPQLPHLLRAAGHGHLVASPKVTSRPQVELIRHIHEEESHVVPRVPQSNEVVAGFYTPWQSTSLSSLRANAGRLTHVMPQWLHLTPDGKMNAKDGSIQADPRNQEVLSLAQQHGLRIQPILDNSTDGIFDPKRSHALLSSPAKQTQLAESLVDWLTSHHCDGVNLDLEDLDSEDAQALGSFAQRLATAFQSHGLTISIDVQPEDDDVPLAQLAKVVDFVVVMVYDRHSEDTAPGPIAPLPWTDTMVEQTMRKVPANKLVLGIGNYAYDWTPGKRGTSLSYGEAMAQANGYREPEDKISDIIDFDPTALNSTYRYDDEDNRPHVVWLLDAASAYNQWRTARDRGLRGAALWSLGSEDPGVWQFLDVSNLQRKLKAEDLATVSLSQDVDTVGQGEILQVESVAKPGTRTVEMEPTTGLIEDVTYQSLPVGYVLRKSGYQPKSVVLSFDDGPDPEWTPKILDVLKANRVPATFFVVGQNAEAHPDLVRQMLAEGHEVGSHSFTHPNLAAVSDQRALLELNATQRAIEALTGRSTILFRPPYNADSTPSTGDELGPILTADRLGYITVGENVDPNDWDLTQLTGAAKAHQIEADILRQIAKGDGNIVLLHDGGGSREATVAAVAAVIPKLKQQGYRFVSVGDLLGRSRAEVMPPLSPRDQLLIYLDGAVFRILWDTGSILSGAFLLAIALGFLRVAIILPLAALHRRRAVASPFTGPVTVIIAAYNEAKVINRTVESVLASDYPAIRVLVVDDGSSDGTEAVVRAAFSDDPRVTVLEKPNGGKASALNLGIEQSDGEVFVGVDADTQLDPMAIRRLVASMSDPEIGAVAGNVRVGNEDRLLTIWQSVEYTTAQNFDRRAYAVLNAVTVVPGAIGAWRRSAVLAAGGYQTDTLAEDMDLTWRLREQGFRIETENAALAFTEAPDQFSSFFKQRFRWAYGTLQCLWKHRTSLGRYQWFGWLALPSLWLFQVVFMVLAPLVDLQVAWSLLNFWWAWQAAATAPELSPLPQAMQNLTVVLTLYLLFFAVEMVTGLIAFRWERRSPWPLAWLFLQRLVYRQIMYLVVLKSLLTAIRGARTGWGKLDRKATVRM
jgi:cellulose synthase/poly-beta-1,6-N-acetylglucosamine synthase-like glycosyltransferase/peptidoglycan/xylan/chitin deacetylase (PgdA/CDA1 family)/spore germination protein YaaH